MSRFLLVKEVIQLGFSDIQGEISNVNAIGHGKDGKGGMKARR